MLFFYSSTCTPSDSVGTDPSAGASAGSVVGADSVLGTDSVLGAASSWGIDGGGWLVVATSGGGPEDSQMSDCSIAGFHLSVLWVSFLIRYKYRA